jgi:hypothetical protein
MITNSNGDDERQNSDNQGVFDFSPLGGSAGGPGCGQPWPGPLGQHLLFDSNVSNEPGEMRIVFDLSPV